MLTDITQIGLRPTLAGLAALIVAAISGWGIGEHAAFLPVRWVRWWMERVIIRGLSDNRFVIRGAIVFANNATTCALLIAAGALPAGSWIAIVLVGLTMGIAIRALSDASSSPAVEEESKCPQSPDRLTQIGLSLNLLEAPAIIVTLGLSMGRLAAPNTLSETQTWDVYVLWVVPALLVAAIGEAIWVGKIRPFSR